VARRALFLLLVLGACARPVALPAVGEPGAEFAAAAVPLELRTAVERALRDSAVTDELRAFYTLRDYRPVFAANDAGNRAANSAIDTLELLVADGLRYRAALDRARLLLSCATNADSLAVLDVLLAGLWVDAARALSGQRVTPSRIDSSWALSAAPVDPIAALGAAAGSGQVVAAIAPFRPSHPEYEALRAALRRYHALVGAGGWPHVAAGPTLGPGAAGPRVGALRARLAAEGDLVASGDGAQEFDAAVLAAVRRFQRRHGLAADGFVGDQTLAALNTSVEQRIRQLEANLERWRWMPRRLQPPYLLVNIPAFELRLVDADTTMTRRVILGRLEWETPLLASTISRVVIAPPWGVPGEIARQEVIPALRADTGYVARNGMLVYADNAPAVPVDPATVDWTATDSAFAYRLVQLPGPSNPLGRVKLVFENRFGVYLHDTPGTDLFAEPERALSHGCVRVEGALELAAWLARGAPGWSAERLASAATEWSTRTVRLARPVPIYLTYFTVWVDAAGELQFRDDLYGWDARLSAALGF